MACHTRWMLLYGILSACTPEIPDGVLVCSPGADSEECPSGFVCRPDLRCYRDPVEGVDASARALLDAASEPGTGAGARGSEAPDEASMRDAAQDAGVRVTCRTPDSGIVCDDGRFCNGAETCQPSAMKADARGCLAGNRVVCGDGQLCSETRRGCITCQAGSNDGDGDRHDAVACGGDDCDDVDPRRHPGSVEACDGYDDDCDGTVDEAAATATCVISASRDVLTRGMSLSE